MIVLLTGSDPQTGPLGAALVARELASGAAAAAALSATPRPVFPPAAGPDGVEHELARDAIRLDQQHVHRLAVWIDPATGIPPERVAFLVRRHHTQDVSVAPMAGAPTPEWARDLISSGALRQGVAPWRPDPPRIESERLVLTWPTEAQCREYYHLIKGTHIFENLCWDGPNSEEDLIDFDLQAAITSVLPECARTVRTSIIEKSSGRVIGGISYRDRHGASVPQGDLGYALEPGSHDKGYGTEAIGAMTRHIFGTTDVRRIEAEVFVGNTASRRALEKNGFTLEGTNRGKTRKGGVDKDEWLLAILAPAS